MNNNTNAILGKLAAASLERCLLRLSRVSAGTWQILELKVFSGSAADALSHHDFTNPASAVYFNLGSRSDITALMLFNRADMESISKGFTGHSFPRGERTSPAEEIMLLELGNIVMNALANSVLNALKKSSMPAVPQFVEGYAARLAKALEAVTDLSREFRIIKATVAIRCDNTAVTNSEVFALVPAGLVSELESPLPQPGKVEPLK